jgi:hypothetical protein
VSIPGINVRMDDLLAFLTEDGEKPTVSPGLTRIKQKRTKKPVSQAKLEIAEPETGAASLEKPASETPPCD